MVTIENPDVLESFVAAQTRRDPPSRKIKDMDREVFVSNDDLGPLRGTRLLPQLGDFNLAFPGLGGGQAHLSAIQSHRYRSPEVLLGTPWSFSTDIWNLGLMVSYCTLNPTRGRRIF
jgi:serine/threonine-protein kinase SRPK3